jgi:hypothetical protein
MDLMLIAHWQISLLCQQWLQFKMQLDLVIGEEVERKLLGRKST